jgi:hypothetical protein
MGCAKASIHTTTFEYSEFCLYIFGIDCPDTRIHFSTTDSSVAENSVHLGSTTVSLSEWFLVF